MICLRVYRTLLYLLFLSILVLLVVIVLPLLFIILPVSSLISCLVGHQCSSLYATGKHPIFLDEGVIYIIDLWVLVVDTTILTIDLDPQLEARCIEASQKDVNVYVI